MSKLKTYVLMVSRTFPANHPRKGEQTFFTSYIRNTLINDPIHPRKIHTIRANYPLWEKRIREVQEGRAVLSLRYWSASPYNSRKDNSKQIEFARLDGKSGVGVQKIAKAFLNGFIIQSNNYRSTDLTITEIAVNDGLSRPDFEAWFKGYDLSEPLAIIHFTPFRY